MQQWRLYSLELKLNFLFALFSELDSSWLNSCWLSIKVKAVSTTTISWTLEPATERKPSFCRRMSSFNLKPFLAWVVETAWQNWIWATADICYIAATLAYLSWQPFQRVSGGVRNEDTSVACKFELECVWVASPPPGAKGWAWPAEAPKWAEKRDQGWHHVRTECMNSLHHTLFSWMLHGSTKVVVRAVALLSAKTKWEVANTLERFFPRKQQIRNNTTKQNHQPQCSLPESAGKGGWSLFLGRLDQGLVGNAESTHVNRPREKATLVP